METVMADESGSTRALVWGGGREGRGPFHAHDGWYFDRDAEGQVRIAHYANNGPQVDASIVMDAATWVSVVTSVTSTPDDSETYQAVAALHDA